MKHQFAIPIVALFVIGCILVPIQAAPDTRNFNFSGFTEVNVGYGMHVVITQGRNFQVTVTAEPDTFERLKVYKSGPALQFEMNSNGWFRNNRGRVDIEITMPVLKGMDLSGGAECDLTMDVASENVHLGLSGGAELKGQLRCADIEVSASGGGEITLAGSADKLRLDGSGGSEFHLRDFGVKDVAADMSGGSTATVNMNGTLDGELSGGSEIVYYGTATVGNTDFSGGAKVRKGN